MNAKQLIAAVTMCATAGFAFAGGSTEFVDFSNVKSTKTRAEVRAEIEQAYAEGKLGQYSEFVVHPQIASTKTRADVRKEAVQAAKGSQAGAQHFGG